MSSLDDRIRTKWHIPPIFRGLTIPRRYKVFWGGRGGAKTQTAATMIVGLLFMRQPIMGQPFRVLCGREYQNSIDESVHFEIVAAIHRLGLNQYFKITKSGVLCLTTGAQVVYRGMHNNIDQIKSLGGIDLFWGEEAHSFTEDSLIYIDPTIRRDPPFGPYGTGSEIWFTFNQTLDTDPIYTKFKCNFGAWEDARTMVVPVTWKDNYIEFNGPRAMELARKSYPDFPDHRFVTVGSTVRAITFPQVLEDQRIDMEAHDDQGYYQWVWGTQCRNLGGIFFALKDLLVHDVAPDYPKICDSVFAVIDTASKTGREHDGTAVTFFAANRHGSGIPLMILDWQIEQIQGSMLEKWLPNVFLHCKYLSEQCGARYGSLGAFIEDKSSGTILLQQAASKGWPAAPIESKLTAMGKVERAIAASPYVCRSQVKFSKPAFDKVVPYKGITANHLLTQVRSFRVGDTEIDQDDLLDCFDENTEVLTEAGWKRFSDLNRTETVATVNLAADLIQYQKPTAYVQRHHSGEMICIAGKRIDICVTPNHRMIVEGTNAISRGEYRPTIQLAKNLKATNILKNTSRWLGRVDPIVIPAWKYLGARAQPMPQKKIDRKVMATFVGWFIAEGCRIRRNVGKSVRRRVIISQMPGEKANEIEEMLSRLPFKHHRILTQNGCYNFTITSAQLYEFLNDCFVDGTERPCFRKRIPQWVLGSSSDILEAFFDAMVKGDGWVTGGHRTIATTSKTLADQLQECLIKMGRASTMKVRDNVPSIKIRNVQSATKSAVQYHVNEIRSKYVFPVNRNQKTSIISRKQYDGLVYCVSVPNGTLLVRRNGKTFLAGNCFTYGVVIALGNSEGF